MNPERWTEIQRVFHEALTRPAGEQEAWLAEAYPDDAELRAEVASLLAAHTDETFLETPVVDFADVDGPDDGPGDAPASIGPYAVIRPLGEGGMGHVFLATQTTDAFTRPVAIKVVKRGMDTDEVIRRFRLERRILAMLVHPNIAQLHDAGVTADGRPYFVMEFVDGERIDAWADERDLTTAARLELFQAVCSAVQHAHQNLVVHRDIKPGNVLVTADGVPKLLDFGIGKLLSDTGQGGDSLTRTRARRLTPDYASPEQLRGQPVTTAADVYGLGVLLYELLTGTRPWPTAESDEERLTRMASSPPPRPSHTVAALGEPSSASRRARELRGDLDNIVLKAMHPDPARRYGSAAALSEDIDRHLVGRPVRARPDSVGYRASKFVRRNAWSVTTAAAVAVALVGITVTTVVQSRRVARERDKAQAVQGFLLETFGASTAEGTTGDSVTVRQLLDGQVEVVRTAYEDDAELRAEMLTVLADAYERLGLFDDAEALARESLAERQALLGDAHPDVAFTSNLLGWILHQQGRSEEAAALVEASVAAWRELGDEEQAGLARALNDLGAIYDQLGRPDEAEPLLREALELRRGAGSLDRAVAITSSNLATLLYRKGEYAAADSLGQAALDALRASVGPDHQRTFIAQSNLAIFRWVAGDMDGAAQLYDDLIERRGRLEGGRNARTAADMVTYASLRRAQGRPDEAEGLLREALTIQEEVLDPEHRAIANTTRTLGALLQQTGRPEEGLEMLLRALRVARAAYGEVHRQVADAELGVGLAYESVGRLDLARTYSELAADHFTATVGPDHPQAIAARVRFGSVLLQDGALEPALAVLAEAHRLASSRESARADDVVLTRYWLAEATFQSGDVARADSLLRATETALGDGSNATVLRRSADLRDRIDASR